MADPRRRPDVRERELLGGKEKRDIVIQDHDPAWALSFRAHRRRVLDALGAVAGGVEHIGSTAVPGLAAKPVVDMLLLVADVTAEEDYVDPLVRVGYALRWRDPGHRLLRTPERDVHLHVLEPGDPEVDEYLLLRDHLRRDAADRALYAATKRALAAQDWPDLRAYATAKTDVITAIKARARLLRDTGTAPQAPDARP